MTNSKSKWITVSVKAHFGWPTERIELSYEGQKYLIRPETDDLEPTVSVFHEGGLEFQEGQNLINRFLSALAWSENHGISVLTTTGSNMEEPIRIGKWKGKYVSSTGDQRYLPAPTDTKALRALAIYREAMSVNSYPYQFLGFFKVLNIRFSKGSEQKEWINNNINEITDYRGLERYKELSDEIDDFGSYLYHQGRCAVAHAFTDDVIDPDISEESRRLEKDVWLMKAIAEHMISKEFGVPTDSQFRENIRDSRNN
jgi:hypothetical protein